MIEPDVDGNSLVIYTAVLVFFRPVDFWLACGGASVGLLALVLVVVWHGGRELDGLDFVLSEFHLGATYDAIIRRLWRHRQVDVVLIPLVFNKNIPAASCIDFGVVTRDSLGS